LQADVGWVEQELNEVRGDCRVLKEERDEARADYALLLESSTAVADNLREDIRQLRSQLEAERADRAQLETQLAELQAQLATLTAVSAASQAELRSQLAAERTSRQQLQTELASTREELAKLKENPPPATAQNPAAEVKLPDAADLLNQLKKANGKKFTASLQDVEKILESLGVEES
jgi:chromosome segregation ATPase